MLKYFPFLFVAAFIISCNQEDSGSELKKISVTDSLNGTTIKINPKVTMPSKVYIVDNKLIVYDNIKKDIFKVFKLPELEHLYSWGYIGKGPNEFIAITQNSMRVYDKKLEVLDWQKLKTYQIKRDTFVMLEKRVMPSLGSPINQMVKINDSIFFADNPMNDNEDFEHVVINVKQNKVINKFGKYPDDGLKFNSNYERYQSYSKNCIVSPNGKKFAAFYIQTNRIKIYDIKGNILKDIIVDMDKRKEFSLQDSKNIIIYYAEPFAIDKYIYVLSINKSKTEVEKNFNKFAPNLQIWDWEGNPIIEYNLNKPITSFYISKKYKKLYGISFFNMDEVYEFDIPDSLFTENKDQLSFKNIEHKYFKAKMFHNWKINTQTEEYSEYQRNGLDYVRHSYFNPARIDNCGTSIRITTISNPNNEKMDIEKYHNTFFIKMIDFVEDLKFTKTTVNNKIVYHYTFKHSSIDPKGERSNNNFVIWLWEYKNKLYEISFRSCSEYEKYYDGVLDIVSTIEIK